MSNEVKPVPDQCHSVTPFLMIDGVADAIAFYAKALGAEEKHRMQMPNGKIAHAEIQIGDSRIMMADETPEMGPSGKGPKAFGGSPVSMYIYLPDVDEAVDRAVAAGAKLLRKAETQFYGDRSGSVECPFGYAWHLATHVEDVAPDEMKRRAAEWAAQSGFGQATG